MFIVFAHCIDKTQQAADYTLRVNGQELPKKYATFQEALDATEAHKPMPDGVGLVIQPIPAQS